MARAQKIFAEVNEETRLAFLEEVVIDVSPEEKSSKKPSSSRQPPKCFACKKAKATTDGSSVYMFCKACMHLIEFSDIPASLLVQREFPDLPTAPTKWDWCIEQRTKFKIELLRQYWKEELKANSSDRFECFICKELMIKPTQCFPCRHTFCDVCLRHSAAEQREGGLVDGACTICWQRIHYTAPNDGLKEQMKISHCDEDCVVATTHSSSCVVQEDVVELPLPSVFRFLRFFHWFYLRLPKPSLEGVTHHIDNISLNADMCVGLPAYVYMLMLAVVPVYALIIGLAFRPISDNSSGDEDLLYLRNQTDSTFPNGTTNYTDLAPPTTATPVVESDLDNLAYLPIRILMTQLFLFLSIRTWVAAEQLVDDFHFSLCAFLLNSTIFACLQLSCALYVEFSVMDFASNYAFSWTRLCVGGGVWTVALALAAVDVKILWARRQAINRWLHVRVYGEDAHIL